MKSFFLLCLLTTAAYGMGAPQPQKPAPVPVETPIPIKDPDQIKVVLNVSGTPAQIVRLTTLKTVVERIINSAQFKTRVEGAYYNKKLQFVDTKLSNKEVYETLRKGSELKSPADYVWNLEINVKRMKCSVLGETNPSIRSFTINSCGFDSRVDSGLVGTICHEYSHKLGFDHSFKWTSSREFSEPYAVGTICAELYPLFK